MNDLKEKALFYHKENKGKIAITSKVALNSRDDLSLAYTPGVAFPCLEIKQDSDLSYSYTSRGNTIAVITDGTAVLGLGDIGPLAAMPVMEGKCLLFKKFADIDAIPICLSTTDTEEIIETIKNISCSFGGINLEDISFPRCIEIEKRLKEELNIPVFHDDQHGTAIVVGGAILNALKVVNKDISNVVFALSGLGAAGSSIAKQLRRLGAKKIYAYNKEGIISKKKTMEKAVLNLVDDGIIDSFDDYKEDKLKEIVRNADCFIGVSVGNVLTVEDIDSMKEKPIVFALANPIPEISYEEVKKSKAYIYATGRSDLPNQINNVLVFPGIFKGALSARCKISEDIFVLVSKELASLIKDEELSSTNIIPSVFDERVVKTISSAIIKKQEINI